MGDGWGRLKERRSWALVVVLLLLVAGLPLVATRLLDGSSPEVTPAAADRRLAGSSSSTTTSTTGSTTTTTTVAPTTTAAPATTAPPSTSPAPRPPAASTPKKGVSVWDFPALETSLGDAGAAWYYNWSAGPSGGAGGSAEFVPMIWGPRSVNAGELARAKASGSVLLGFNEPDFASQANMSPEQALDLWPQLQATGLRLGSPAVAFGGADPGGWLDRFMSGAEARGLRVDFITLHWYGSDFSAAAVGHLQGYIESVHDRYGLPIWLTEYALIKFGDGGSTFPTDAQQAAFVTGSTEMLESLPYLERYAWFALPVSDDHQGTGLYHPDGTPTPAGTAYRAAG